MVSWRFYGKSPKSSFYYYQAAYGKYHKIAVSKIGDTVYTVRWYYGHMIELTEHIEAKDWDEAKASALSIVKDYLAQQAAYWRDLKTGVNNWINY